MKKSLPRDSRWEPYVNNSFEYFKSIADDISFRKEVSEEVVSRFKVVKELVTQSYFVYDFLDVAYERALLTLEMAIKIRYEEIEGEEWNDNKDFKALINWGADNYLFEDEREVIHTYREFRNWVSHPDEYSLLGFSGLRIVFRVMEIINGMYEDTEKRIQRIQKINEINEGLSAYSENGTILGMNSKRYIIFLSSLLHFDNRNEEPVYYFLFFPIFDPREKDGKTSIPDPFVIEAYDFVNIQNRYFIRSEKNSSAILNKIEKEENRKRYRQFFKDLNENRVAAHMVEWEVGEQRRSILRNQVKVLE